MPTRDEGECIALLGTLDPLILGWIAAEDGASENNRRAKFYRLTPKGRKQLAVETTKWDKLARAIAGILRPAGGEGKS